MTPRTRRPEPEPQPALISRHVVAVEPEFLRARDIEAFCGLSHGVVSELMHTATAFGGLPVREIAGVRGVLLEDLRAWVRDHHVIN